MERMLACASKLEKVCCTDAVFKREMCIPFHYCQVAIGERPAGPLPPCSGPSIHTGDPAKCDKDEPTLKDEAKFGLMQCEKQLQGLYDLERSLVECAHEVAIEKSALEVDTRKVRQITDDAQKCQDSKQSQSGGTETQIREQMSFCAAHAAEIEEAWLEVAAEQAVCIRTQIPRIEIHIPDIEIEIPEVQVQVDGNISSPSFNVDVQAPDFSAPSFDGSVVVPGGGGKLNVHAEKALTLDQRKESVRADIKACEDSKAKVAPMTDRIRSARADAERRKAQACEDGGGSLLQDPADEVIGILYMQKQNPIFLQCAKVGSAIDALVAVLREC